MDLGGIPLESFIKEGIFCLLFIWLLITQKKESNNREERLMNHVEKTTETLDVLSQRMENVSSKVDHIDTRLNEFEQQVSNLKEGK
ncbi:BhlA/UviB family holin-like peptide [Heyndrickxia shackletonii]|uniref:BhlA/UviB family holin-like peptide n=1 Tax=Heyndrickxia shackletonii TaxID=157838 RepID=UPI0006EBE530|nr:BhlA/UviB family holin-like peptide [Heyndrickxia shackletonii]NEZ02376.1 holin [Heyndrickxia shackletonii]